MGNHNLDFEALGSRIKKILYDYVKIESYTATESERKIEEFFRSYTESISYFREHPENCGLYSLSGDGLSRNVCWAMVRGKGKKTVCMVHHYDIVDVEDYKLLKNLAFSPDELEQELLRHKDLLTEEAAKDLKDGTFLFCRGGCDMKAGGAIQYALLEAYSRLAEDGKFDGNVIVIGVPDEENLSAGMRAAVKLLSQLSKERGLEYVMMINSEPHFDGNVIVIGVPDEENLSAGMRAAVKLLSQLSKERGLEYVMMINSEPHQRKDFAKGVFSEGTVGKMMPFVYVRGYLSHAGKVFEGLNPSALLSEIAVRTEINMDFADRVGCEAAPPPTWLYQKDSKTHYDVSMPLSAQGCFSVLTLKQTPEELLGKVRKVCEEAFDAVIRRMNENYVHYCRARNTEDKPLPWQVSVSSFGELYEEAFRQAGETFAEKYRSEKEVVLADIQSGKKDMIEGTFSLIEVIYDYIEDISPRVVFGLVPPYYPNVSNLYFDEIAPEALGISEKLSTYTYGMYGQLYETEYFYTGICDLSYINTKNSEAQRAALTESMPLFGADYDIPFEEIEDISMAGINIGPWGKDFHKLTERVYKEDLYVRTPKILDHAVKILLGGSAED